MAKSNNQKAKILFLERMLQDTDEKTIVTMQEIIARLAEAGISAERKSIYDDLEVLRSFGMDIRFRRERPSGYYLANGQKETLPKAEDPVEAEENQEPEKPALDTKAEAPSIQWKIATEYKKPLRLLCSNSRRQEMEQYFGEKAIYQEKNENQFLLVIPPIEGPGFYGWLTTMGKDVRIVKPKKTAAAYKEYLKSILKEYKGI